MKYLITLMVILVQGLALSAEWYEGDWVYDAALTQKKYPTIPSSAMSEVEDGFDKWAGKITVTPKRVKGKGAALGVPYEVVGRSIREVYMEIKGPAIEMVKAFNPDLRKQKLRCRIVQISSNVVAFEVPELQTIQMYLRRVK